MTEGSIAKADPAAPPGGDTAAYVPPKQYEFDDGENAVMARLAMWMGVVGVMLCIFGGLFTLAGVLTLGEVVGGFGIAQGILLLFVGSWLWSASRSFKDIVHTQGSDILLLMHALRRLLSAFRLQAVILVISCVLAIGVGVALALDLTHSLGATR